ncbi:MAG: efflux RND transporter permease subunit [Gemmatimonadales bacterium]|nr:MAG: efflux RND transporter permease subunit [Gemmatimonadales bacterium]
MLARVIEWSASNRFLVSLGVVAVIAAGVQAIRSMPLEAIPDLSDVQVIVRTDYPGQAPQIVEDQVTYPISSEMLQVPGAQTVRGYSFFGTSFVYVIFEDGTDLYWARSRVLEYLSAIEEELPPAAEASLGPDATGLGWVYQYVVEDTTGQMSLAELRSFQDFVLRYQLTSLPGVAEVATVGGFEKTYEVTVDPVRLQGYGIPVTRVMEALRGSNQDVGATVLEMAEREYMIRGLGYLRSLESIEDVVVGATTHGTPIRVADLATVREAPALRRGIADLDGRGDVVGGIVVMRFGENALATIDRVKERLAEVSQGFPEGVVVRPVYDRSDLIHRAIDTLREKLLEESLVVALVCLLFLFHLRSALVSLVVLPLGILMAFIAMRGIGINADIMSLGGIAIAIGAMIDASIVMVENLHKHLERVLAEKGAADRGNPGILHTDQLTTREHWQVVVGAAKEVGPALFFTLLIITVSFVPVFALEAQEGRLFRPLAWTKTLSMASAALLSVTVVPVAMGIFIRGRIHREDRNPVSRVLIAAYRPVLDWALRHRPLVLAGSLATVLLTLVPLQRIGSEFMPPLNEGTILYMPTTLPGISVAAAGETLQRQDSILASFPEVVSVFGKAGRANTATDPAPMAMFETTIVLKPESEWRPGITPEALVDSMDAAIRFAGVTNSWTMPIKGRIDMLATGIRTPVGVKVFGPELPVLERLAKEVEAAVAMVPGTRSAYGERVMAGSYLDVEIDREAAARYGLNVETIQQVLASAVGGAEITRTVEGRERYAVRLRYPQELRDRPEAIGRILIPVPGRRGEAMLGMATPEAMSGLAGQMGSLGGRDQIPLAQVATLRTTRGPMMVKTENAFPTAWVFVDVEGRDVGSYVADARAMVESMVSMPAGYTLEWSGQYAYMERAKQRLSLVVPATLLIIAVLLFLTFGRVAESLMVLASLPLALVGGVLLLAGLGFQWSVATAVGFIALAGVAAETGVIMLLYLTQAWDERRSRGDRSVASLREAVMEGAVLRVRPKMMTVVTIIAGLLPLFWGRGAGSEIMQRIAAPMIGGMVSALALTLIVLPVLYSIWHEYLLAREGAQSS